MREATLPRGRIVLNERGSRRTGRKLSLFSTRRLGVWAVLGIAGVAAIGVPMNALFFQDGSHPAPIFAGHAPPAPVEAARVETPVEAVDATQQPEAAPARQTVKRNDLAADELAALSAEPAARAPRVAREPAKAAADKPAAKAAAKPAAKSAPATTEAKPAAAKPAPAAAAKPAATTAAKPAAPAAAAASKPAAAKPAAPKAASTTPKPPVKPAAAKADAKPEAKGAPHAERASVSDLIGNLLGGAH